MRYVIELRRVIDRSEEPRQIVEEGIVATTDKRFDGEAIRCVDAENLVNIDYSHKTDTVEIDESEGGAIGRINCNPDLCCSQGAEVLILDAIKISEQSLQAMVVLSRRNDSRLGEYPNSVQHVVIQYTRFWN